MSQTTQAAVAGPSRRDRAYARATRHTRRVRWLRKTILWGCLAAISAIVAVTFFDPFGKLPRDLSVGQMRLNGSRVTLELPKLSGFRQDGRPYDVRAASGVQDIRKPNLVELNEIEARFEAADQSTIRLTAPLGNYDSGRDFMQLVGDVHITSTKGYDVRMTDADMDLKAGNVVSNNPVTVVASGGTIAADRVSIADNGKQITFTGNVRSVFKAGPDADKEDLKGAIP